MEYELAIICSVALLASLLTFFSGFGLGTLLTPAFMLFFPIDTAITLTAIVHLLNNIFKSVLVGKNIDYTILLKFGLPGIVGAFVGAKALFYFTGAGVIMKYTMGGAIFEIKLINLIIASLMILFSFFEILPRFKQIKFGEKALIPGGALSGFFGGLSGHQGALRSMFLIKVGLTKEAFIATGVGIACLVDVIRLGVYFQNFESIEWDNDKIYIISATLSAFVGAYLGKKVLKKVTLDTVQITVAILVIMLAIGLGLGIV